MHVAFPLRPVWLGLGLILAAAATPVLAQEAPQANFEIRDGDRIALLGGTFVEREQQYGYLELALQLAHPQHQFTVRNLGWSGDIATARSRARFGDEKEGFNHLMKSLDLVDPTVIVVCYGTGEAFDGEAGLDKFRTNYAQLLDALQQRTERIVMITPPAMENLGPPLPDPAPYNHNLQAYRQAIEELAYDRGHTLVDLTRITSEPYQAASDQDPPHLTSNGMHFTQFGYWYLVPRMLEALGVTVPRQITLDAAPLAQNGETSLPQVYPPAPTSDQVPVAVAGLSPGTHKLQLGQNPPVQAAAEAWQQGVLVSAPKLAERTEALRQAILRKDQLFFDRYRPQNETYLYLFRKHEQGNNAVEIPQFDPLIEEQQQVITERKQPVALTVRVD